MMNRRLLVWVWLGFVALSPSWAISSEYEKCTTETKRDEICTLKVDDLSPTQFAVGMREVLKKKEKIEGKSEKKLDEYLEEHLVPVVISPTGKFYLTDHHHLTRALYEADTTETRPKKKIYAEIQRNWSDKSVAEFWDKMKEKAWVYPYDHEGKGPLPIGQLPKHVKSLKDDPYRSLAGEVCEEGGYEKSEEPFTEFQWANFFRTRITIGHGETQWKAALRAALKLAKSKAAKHLPGYLGE